MTNDSKSTSISIEDIIEYWHTHETRESLREFLGMSENEYAGWLKGSTSFRIYHKKWKPCKVCERKNDPCYENDCFKKNAPKCRYSCDKYITWRNNQRRLIDSKFCPKCGRPLTDQAWAELEKRLRG